MTKRSIAVTQPDPNRMTVREAAGYLCVTPHRLHELAQARRLGYLEHAHWYFTRAELDAYLAEPRKPGRKARAPKTAHAQTLTPDLFEDFITAKRIAGRSPATIKRYRTRVPAFITYLAGRPLTRAVIRSFIALLQQQQLAPITVRGYVRDLSSFCSWLVDEGILESNPTSKLAPKVPHRRPASYTVDQIRKLLAVCDVRDRAIIITFLDTGLRVGELITLRRDRIDWETGEFEVIGKGNKQRSGWLSPQAIIAIRAYLETRTDSNPALWHGREGPLTITGIHQMLRRRTKQAGIRSQVRRLCHGFRASFAKAWVLNGGDVASLQSILGHESPIMSLRYATLATAEIQAKKLQINPLSVVFEEGG